ncbi:MAG: 2'-5' RNA ligase family protein [Thermomonas sp.]
MATGTQAGFAEFAPPVPTDRLFFALFPDDAAAARIAALAEAKCREHGVRGKPLRSDRLHVTLFHLGDRVGLPEDVVAAAGRAAGAMHGSSFDIAFDTVASFAAHRVQKPFVLKASTGNEALRAFHARLKDALRRAGLGEHARGSFEPHVTLAYDPQLVPAQAVETIAWRAHELVLVHSLLGQTRHVRLASWRLAE